jgi:hypothetical protein
MTKPVVQPLSFQVPLSKAGSLRRLSILFTDRPHTLAPGPPSRLAALQVTPTSAFPICGEVLSEPGKLVMGGSVYKGYTPLLELPVGREMGILNAPMG